MKNKWAQIANQWDQFAVEAKKQWGELTEDELLRVDGNRNNLARFVQYRYFTTKKEAHDQIAVWMNSLDI